MAAKRRKKARPTGRPREDHPDRGKVLSDAQLRRRWPGLTASERRAVHDLVGREPGQIDPDDRRFVSSIRLRGAYDAAALRVLAAEHPGGLAGIVLEAVRAWASGRR